MRGQPGLGGFHRAPRSRLTLYLHSRDAPVATTLIRCHAHGAKPGSFNQEISGMMLLSERTDTQCQRRGESGIRSEEGLRYGLGRVEKIKRGGLNGNRQRIVRTSPLTPRIGTTFVSGRSSGSPSSSSGTFPCNSIMHSGISRIRQAYSSGGLHRNGRRGNRRWHRFPVSPHTVMTARGT